MQAKIPWSWPGTIALEILEDAPDIDTIVVPLGGGGLLSGIAAAVGIGAVLSGQLQVPTSAHVCFVLSGGNWDLDTFIAAFNRT